MKPEKTLALYVGSFDPITLGHLDIIDKALNTFDHVHVAIGTNPRKTRLLHVETSRGLIETSVLGLTRLTRDKLAPIFSVGDFTHRSMVAYAKEIHATHIVRGLRQISDFNDEFIYHGVVEQLDKSLTMAHFICDTRYLHVSSSTARELSALKEDISWLVPPHVEETLREIMSEKADHFAKVERRA